MSELRPMIDSLTKDEERDIKNGRLKFVCDYDTGNFIVTDFDGRVGCGNTPGRAIDDMKTA